MVPVPVAAVVVAMPVVEPIVPVADGDTGAVTDGDIFDVDGDIAFADGGADMHDRVWQEMASHW